MWSSTVYDLFTGISWWFSRTYTAKTTNNMHKMIPILHMINVCPVYTYKSKYFLDLGLKAAEQQ